MDFDSVHFWFQLMSFSLEFNMPWVSQFEQDALNSLFFLTEELCWNYTIFFQSLLIIFLDLKVHYHGDSDRQQKHRQKILDSYNIFCLQWDQCSNWFTHYWKIQILNMNFPSHICQYVVFICIIIYINRVELLMYHIIIWNIYFKITNVCRVK